MAARPASIAGWTRQHGRHVAAMFRQGRNPAARVYESIGSDFFRACRGLAEPGAVGGAGFGG